MVADWVHFIISGTSNCDDSWSIDRVNQSHLRRVCPKFCVLGRVDHHALTKRPSKMMANWFLASHHSRCGIFHFPATCRKTRKSFALTSSRRHPRDSHPD